MRTSSFRGASILVSILTAAGSLALAPGLVSGFDERDTHPRVTERAARQSRLDAVLKRELGIESGVDALLRIAASTVPRSVLGWLRDGATSEDRPTCRATNHFHNPLKSFTSARVSDQPFMDDACPDFRPILSSVTWGTRFVSPAERGPATANPFDWDAARGSFLNALTLGAPTDREAALAQTFEALGHVMHLVQDLAVPAHVRNDFDAHLTNLRFFSSRLTEERFEKYVRTHTGLVNSAAPTPVDVVGRLVTRFWDTDRYTGANPSSDTVQGLAEYTNANFVSLDTILTEGFSPSDPYFFPYPRLSSTNADALFGKDISVARLVRAEDGHVDTGLYVDKIGDGEMITNFLRAGYLTGDFIDRAPPGTPRRLVFQLDDEVHGSYAAKLVPMALGYSRALLDYFVRGRLDVDVFDDGSGLRLAGTNASPDLLDGGTLAVYADGIDGVRRLASAAVAVGLVEAGGALPAVPVTPPPGAERFVAVYTGTLGEERAAETFKGGVIGKVLGGVRVEEVFSDGTRWQLRTPQGVFPLPIPAGRDNIVELRWGDADNTLVGRTDIGPDRPNLMLAYKVNRPAGSVTMPLVTQPDGSRVVDVQETSRKSFPVGLYLGTTIQFSHTIRYKRYLTTLVPTVEYEFDGSGYTFKRVADVQAHLDLVVDDAQTFRRSDPVTLVWNTVPYSWWVPEIGLTADGKILALVQTWLTSPGGQVAVFSGAFDRPEEIPFAFPSGMWGYIWALVDVTDGTLVGGTSTAPPDLVIDHTTTVTRGVGEPGSYTGETVTRYVGGPTPAERRDSGVWFESPGPCDTPPERLLGTILTGGLRTQNETAITVVQYRPEIAGQQFSDPARRPSPDRTEYWVYLCGQPLSVGITITTQPSQSELTFSRLDAVLRAPNDGTGEQLTLLMLQSQPQLDYWDFGKVVTWFPERTTAELRAELTLPGLHYLQAATRQSALVITDVYEPDFDETTRLVSLGGDPSVRVFAAGLWDFSLLAPSYLFNVRDLKFYRPAPPLTRTALPATLSDASGNPIGAYHAVRLP